jgi:hypothetical protein
MPDFGIMRGFNDKLFGDKLYAGQLPTQLGLIGSSDFGIDPDAVAFFNRVTAAGGTLSATEKIAVDTLVKQMKADGTWTPMKAIYPMVGASAAACAQNLKSSSFTGTFTSGWTFASTGVTGNGTSAYMDTGLVPNVTLSQNSVHLSYYRRTTQAISKALMGTISTTGGTNRITLAPNYDSVNNNISEIVSLNNQQSSASISALGLILGSRVLSTEFKIFANGTSVNTVTRTSMALTNLTFTIKIGAINVGASIFDYTNNQCAFSSIGDGLTPTQNSDFYTAVQAFQTTLSRNV